MMEGNNIFLAIDDVLWYLAGTVHKRYSMTFIWGHQFSTCGSYDRIFDPFHIAQGRICTHLEYPRLLRM